MCLNKTFEKEYAQRQSYSESDTIVFDINSGSSYIDPTTCMLSFKLNVTGEAEKNSTSEVEWLLTLLERFVSYPKMDVK